MQCSGLFIKDPGDEIPDESLLYGDGTFSDDPDGSAGLRTFPDEVFARLRDRFPDWTLPELKEHSSDDCDTLLIKQKGQLSSWL